MVLTLRAVVALLVRRPSEPIVAIHKSLGGGNAGANSKSNDILNSRWCEGQRAEPRTLVRNAPIALLRQRLAFRADGCRAFYRMGIIYRIRLDPVGRDGPPEAANLATRASV